MATASNKKRVKKHPDIKVTLTYEVTVSASIFTETEDGNEVLSKEFGDRYVKSNLTVEAFYEKLSADDREKFCLACLAHEGPPPNSFFEWNLADRADWTVDIVELSTRKRGQVQT